MSEELMSCPNPNGCFCDGTCKKKTFKFAALTVAKNISEKEQKALSEAAKIYKEQNNTTLIEKLEGMKKPCHGNFKTVVAYNQALQDAIDLIKEQE